MVSGLTAGVEYEFYVTALNVKGESFRSGVVYQYAGAVPSAIAAPTQQILSRTDTSIAVSWAPPGVSTTTVLGYQVFVNEPDSNGVPTILAYDGSKTNQITQAVVTGLKSGSGYYIAVRALNRAGWSDLSPYLEIIAGRLPSPPA